MHAVIERGWRAVLGLPSRIGIKHANTSAAAVLLLLALLYLVGASDLPLWSQHNAMGPGMFPMALGIVLAVLAVMIWLEPRSRAPSESGTQPWRAPMIVLGILFIYVLVGIPLLGFTLANFALVLAMRRVYEPGFWRTDAAGSGATAIAVHVVFVDIMGLYFPVMPTWLSR